MSGGTSSQTRPRRQSNNPFMCFLQTYREVCSVGRISQTNLPQKAGEIWRKMTDEEKCPYMHEANENQKVVVLEWAIELPIQLTSAFSSLLHS